MVFKVKYAKTKSAGNIAMRKRNILKHKGRNWGKAVLESTLDADSSIILGGIAKPRILAMRHETEFIKAMKKRNVPRVIRKRLIP